MGNLSSSNTADDDVIVETNVRADEVVSTQVPSAPLGITVRGSRHTGAVYYDTINIADAVALVSAAGADGGVVPSSLPNVPTVTTTAAVVAVATEDETENEIIKNLKDELAKEHAEKTALRDTNETLRLGIIREEFREEFETINQIIETQRLELETHGLEIIRRGNQNDQEVAALQQAAEMHHHHIDDADGNVVIVIVVVGNDNVNVNDAVNE